MTTCWHRHVGDRKCTTFRFDTPDTYTFTDPFMFGGLFHVRVHEKGLRFSWNHNKMACGRWSRYYEIPWTMVSADASHLVCSVADITHMDMQKAGDHMDWMARRLSEVVLLDVRAQPLIAAAANNAPHK